MIMRCSDPEYNGFHNYGGRGITVCEEWRVLDNFLKWAIVDYQPGLTIERDDVNGNYEPGNCRWIPRKEQAWNLRKTINLTAFGETKCIGAWARDPRCIVCGWTIQDRVIRRGWSAEDALTVPSIIGRPKS